jgi:hypothetical protein
MQFGWNFKSTNISTVSETVESETGVSYPSRAEQGQEAVKQIPTGSGRSASDTLGT